MAADQATPTLYDQIPYPSLSFNWSHPSHLATLATLVGMQPVPVEHCRVLELGCAGGGNLIPMAYSLPDSEFVGIDLSIRQIAAGQEAVTALGLPNITLEHMDILDVSPDFGQFDYIIAHGIYSWVPPAVQDKLLGICQQNLTPNGVAYISYNTYPGWRMLGAVREMMLYHTRHIEDPKAQVAEARVLLDFLAQSIQVNDSAHADFLNAYLNFVKAYFQQKNDAYVLHDELSEVNEPIYFYQFAERAAGHGLRYLADADFKTMLASNLPGEVAQTLRQLAKDTITLEQYLDFLRGRTFRQSLLCHQAVQLKSGMGLERLANFYVASHAIPESAQPDTHSKTVEKFKASDGTTLSTDHPVTKLALLYLAEIWPKAIPFRTLLDTARARLNGARSPEANPAEGDARVLAANLLKGFGYSEDLVELQVYLPRFVLEISERPVASPIARWQAQYDHRVTNLRHERIQLEGVGRHLLAYLDGSRDHAALQEILMTLALEGRVEIRQDDQPVTEAEQIKRIVVETVKTQLRQLARAALLVG